MKGWFAGDQPFYPCDGCLRELYGPNLSPCASCGRIFCHACWKRHREERCRPDELGTAQGIIIALAAGSLAWLGLAVVWPW